MDHQFSTSIKAFLEVKLLGNETLALAARAHLAPSSLRLPKSAQHSSKKCVWLGSLCLGSGPLGRFWSPKQQHFVFFRTCFLRLIEPQFFLVQLPLVQAKTTRLCFFSNRFVAAH